MHIRLLILIPIFIFISCGGSDHQQATPDYVYTQPLTIDDGWETGTLASKGMDEQPFLDMVDYLNGLKNHEVHSILVIKDHTLVFEVYFKGHDYCFSCPDFHGDLVDWGIYTRHNTHSVTKSITSTLTGIAIDQGYISSVQDKIFDYLPEYMDLWDEQKDLIRIEHVLTMSAGLQWNTNAVDITSSANDLIRMTTADDPIMYILEKPVVAPPGTQFYYSGGCTNILGQILRNATGLSVTDYANQVLLGPLEIGDRDWPLFSNGMEYTSGDLPLTPREMAKIGEVFINNGYWKGQQIVSESWIEQATQHHIFTFWDYDGYGFQWWISPLNVGHQTLYPFCARGWGDNTSYVSRISTW